MNVEFKVIILAVFDKAAFPQKAMIDIHGKPMIEHVFDSAKKSGAAEIVIATNNTRVGMSAEDFGAKVCMVVDTELSDIARLAQVVDMMAWDDDVIIVSLPGDVPLIPCSIIQQVAKNLYEQTNADCTTLYSIVSHNIASKNSTIITIVDNAEKVMYLSRKPIPHQPESTILSAEYKCNIGINAYRSGLLRIYQNLPSCEVDQAENIDELKFLLNGMTMHAAEANNLIGQRVLTKADVEKVKIQIAPNR